MWNVPGTRHSCVVLMLLQHCKILQVKDTCMSTNILEEQTILIYLFWFPYDVLVDSIYQIQEILAVYS